MATRPKHPGPRHDDRLKHSRNALINWRCEYWEHNYGDCSWGPQVLMSDIVVMKLATRTHLQTVEAIKLEIPEWDFAEEHGAEALAIIERVDGTWKQEHDRQLQQNKAKRKQASSEKRQKRDKACQEEKRIATVQRHAAALQPAQPDPNNIPASLSAESYNQQYATWYYSQHVMHPYVFVFLES